MNENMLARVMEEVPVGIVTLDPKGTILSANRRAEEILGVSSEEMVGRTYNDTKWGIHGSDGGAYDDGDLPFAKVMETGESVHGVEHAVLRPEGEPVVLSIDASPLKGPGGAIDMVVVTLQDVTHHEYVESELRHSQKRYQEQYENAPDGIVSTNMEGYILECNPAFEQMLGYRLEELREIEFTQFTPQRWHEWEAELIQNEIVAKGYSGRYEKEYIHKDGHVFPVELSVFLHRDTKGNPTGMWAFVRDISHRKKAERRLKRLLQEVEVRHQEMQSFMYVASHDLRSPLVNVEGFAGELSHHCRRLSELLECEQVSQSALQEAQDLLREQVPQAVKFIHASTGKMQSLLEGLLRLSRVGRFDLSVRPVEMNELMQSIRRAMQYELDQKNAELTVDDLPSCYGDVEQINQLFSNLLSNALKYSHPDRRPSIRVSGRYGDHECVYSVQDNGVGIHPNYHERVFRLFSRLNPSGGEAGEGIGLTLVKRIAERHGGRVWLESEENQGSTFYVALPAQEFSPTE